MGDITAKYEKLATEYAKLKSQITVLKKAFRDEQADSNTVKELLKEKEQYGRKTQQEVESLTFRNQQLSKRVMVLQDDMEMVQNQKKKHKRKGSDLSNPGSQVLYNFTVYDEELQNKIEENAQLHSQLYELSATYDRQIVELDDRVKVAEQDKTHHSELVASLHQHSDEKILQLQQEKAMLEDKLQSCEIEMKNCKDRTELTEQTLEITKVELQDRLSSVAKILGDKLPFVDIRNCQLNRFNLISYNKKHQTRCHQLVHQAAVLTSDFIGGLTNFLSCCEQRSSIYPRDGVSDEISCVNKKETATGLQSLASCFSRMVAYCNMLLPYQTLSLGEEIRLSSCTSSLRAKNDDLIDSLGRINAVLKQMDVYLTMLSEQSKSSGGHHPSSAHKIFYRNLCSSLEHLHCAFKDVLKHYNLKVSLEHQLPTVTQKLKTIDEYVVSSLVSIVTNVGKMSALMSGNLDFFNDFCLMSQTGNDGDLPASDHLRPHPIISDFCGQTSKYLSKVSAKTRPESVPHGVALRDRKILLSAVETKVGLAKQVTLFEDKINCLEQERDHLVLELQLMNMKYKHEQQKTEHFEHESALSHQSNGKKHSVEFGHVDRITSREHNAHLVDSELTTPSLLDLVRRCSPSEDADARERLIKAHFTERINKTTSQLRYADSKAVHFHAEVQALHKHLQLSERQRKMAEDEATMNSLTVAKLKDELQTTAHSYESQLSMMSEHLAGMNEKLTRQSDEIDDLRAQLFHHNSVLGKLNKKSKK